MKKKVNSLTLLISLFLLQSCSKRYLSSVYQPITAPLDYADLENWAVHPQNTPSQLDFVKSDGKPYDIDVFYIHPTMTTSPKDNSWHGDVLDENYRQTTLNTAIKYQCSAWYGLGRTFAPFYRDAHIRSFQDEFKPVGGDAALQSAYLDIKSAFQYYLKHENNGRPIMIVSHSQGTLHAGQLLKDFFEDQPLQKQLVAAYLVGIAVKDDYFQSIPFMTKPDETGGFVTWNTYKRNHLPDDYEQWYKGSLTTNPITWDDQKTTTYDQHKGLTFYDKKLYPNSVKIEIIDGMIWARTPKVPKRFWFSFIKDYHFADITIFWKDIRENSRRRIETFLAKRYGSSGASSNVAPSSSVEMGI